MPTRTTKRYALSIDSRVERLGEIGQFIKQAAHAFGLNEEECCDVEMAVDEACTNVIHYAYQGYKNGIIDLTCTRNGAGFVVTIKDFGHRFDPRKIVKPQTRAPLSRRRVGGLGWFFMNKMMDQIRLEFPRKGGNLLTMVKKIKKK